MSECYRWNEPREGIKAAAADRIYGNGTVNPVGNVVKVNRYRRQEEKQNDDNSDFSSLLEKKAKKRQNVSQPRKDEKLRLMGGLNQYNRHAVQFCFILSHDADYRAWKKVGQTTWQFCKNTLYLPPVKKKTLQVVFLWEVKRNLFPNWMRS